MTADGTNRGVLASVPEGCKCAMTMPAGCRVAEHCRRVWWVQARILSTTRRIPGCSTRATTAAIQTSTRGDRGATQTQPGP
eukprot:1018343-Prorocentrum_minimum.AAC.1